METCNTRLNMYAHLLRSLLVVVISSSYLPIKAHSDPDSLLRIWNDHSASDTTRFDAYYTYLKGIRFWETMPADSAVPLMQGLYDLAGRARSPARQARALSSLSLVHFDAGAIEKAIAVSERALEMLRKSGTEQDEMLTLNMMARYFYETGDIANAIQHLTSALRIADQLQDTSMIARVHGNIGVMYSELGDTANAMLHYNTRLEIAEKIGQKDILCEVLNNIAMEHIDSKRPDLAFPLLQRALALAREIDYAGMEINCLNNLNVIARDRGDGRQALDLCNEALAVAHRLGSPEYISELTIERGKAYKVLGLHAKAIADGEAGLMMASEHGFVIAIAEGTELLHELYSSAGRWRDALRMYERHVQVNDSIESDENKQQLVQQRFQYDFDKKEALLTAEQEKKDALAAEELRRKRVQRDAFIGGFGLMLLLAAVFFLQRNRINKEKARSESLLLNILPVEVAEELKEKGEAEARLIPHATVLFTDFKGFTAMSERMGPKELVKDLHECFSAFDAITEKHGLEKIKTIGDAYMAAGGLPVENSTHARDAILASFEMRDFVEAGKARKIAAGLPYFEIRIGIHTGPVVAGIVGVKKFQYDIWGDTVNIASRMESSGDVGEVNISGTTYELVKDGPGLTFTPRGKVLAKGKGEMEMYFVRHIRA